MKTRSGFQRGGWLGYFLALAVVVAGTGLMLASGARPAKAAAGGTFSFATSSVSVAEGQSVNIGVVRSGSSAQANVCYSRTGGTAPLIDFSPQSGAVTFPASDNSEGFTFMAIDDPSGSATNSGSRTVVYTLSLPCLGDTGSVAAPSTIEITITDDDGSPTYSLGSSTYNVAEAAGTLTIPVTRSGIKTATDIVHCVIAVGTAQAGDITGTTLDQTLTFNPGDTTKNCSITVVNDATTESPNETVTVSLTNPSGGFGPGPITAATVTILDDDGTGTIQFTQATYSVSEAGGEAVIGVSRTGGTTGAASIRCSTVIAGSGGVAGVDYTTTSDDLNWANGEGGTKNCTVPITDDSAQETDETVNLQLSLISGADYGAQNLAVLTIVDNDGNGTIAFSLSNYPVNETAGTVTITATRTGGSFGGVSVNYATSNGTATSGADYTATSGTLSWVQGDTSNKTFNVTILDDSITEGAETINLTLSGLTGGATLGTPSTAVITIADNESSLPVVTSLSPAAGPLGGGNTVTITGTGFVNVTGVTFGGVAAANVVPVSANTITATAPTAPGLIAQTVDVIVTTLAGSSSTIGTGDNYTYTAGPTVTAVSPNTGPTTGTTFVTITGTNFTPSGMTVTFGGTQAIFTYVNSTTISAVSPAHSAGTFDVIVTTAAGSSPNTVLDDFTYTGSSAPIVTGVSPSSGPVGTVVAVTGSGFTGTTLVTVGGVSASFTVNNDGSLTVTIPGSTPGGTVDIRVTTAAGTSANVTADNFTNTSSSGATTTYVLYFRWTLIAWTGIDNLSVYNAVRGIETGTANSATNDVSGQITAIWFWDGASQSYKGYFVGFENVPGANDFTTMRRGISYWVAVQGPGNTNWTVLLGN